MANPDALWQAAWKRALLLMVLVLVPVTALAGVRVGLSVLVGTLLMLGDIALLKAPLAMMRSRVERQKRPWVLALFLARLVLLALVLLLLVKLHLLNIPGALLGATLPLPALLSVLVTGGLTAWKV
jgi:hypothetical protein